MTTRQDKKIVRAVLHRGLSLARPYDGANEREYRDFIRSKIATGSDARGKLDMFGNLWVDIPEHDGTSARTIFTAHLDTVHGKDAALIPTVDPATKIVHAMPGQPLGADDAAGCAILAGMIINGIPGMYLFTRGEERGGRGAAFAAKSIVSGTYDRAIAIDRRGTSDICGSQMGQDLASREYVSTLALALGMSHSWADGIYTDNAEFQGLIPEIVNISAGYYNEHSPKETLDLSYFWSLYDALLSVDLKSMPVNGPDARETWNVSDFNAATRMDDPTIDLETIAADLCASAGLHGWESEIMTYLIDAYDVGYSAGFDGGWTDGRASVKRKDRGTNGRR